MAFDDQERAVSVMLHFMYPTSTGRRVINRGSELRLDELERHKTGLADAH
jgi:hypothetical protein